MKLSSDMFIKRSKAVVAAYENAENKSGDPVLDTDVFVVWYCKTLQNHKALMSTPVSNGLYYEITYNGDADEVYFDVYKKDNKIRIEEASHADWYRWRL